MHGNHLNKSMENPSTQTKAFAYYGVFIETLGKEGQKIFEYRLKHLEMCLPPEKKDWRLIYLVPDRV